MVRYYGYCSNMSRGKPQKTGEDAVEWCRVSIKTLRFTGLWRRRGRQREVSWRRVS
jgi:hypothetical protein